MAPGRAGALLKRTRQRLGIAFSPPAPERVGERYFAEALCRNCGEPLHTPHCAACGQKKAVRFGLGDLRGEAWEKLRLFEANLVWSGLRVVLQPGAVARDYVLGARLSHVHPLKLLLAAIVLLLLVINQTGYLESQNATLGRALALVQTYSKWSFSLGIAAVWLASSLVFWRARGLNAVEHLVLATYTHFVILLASIVSLAPLLWWGTPDAIAAHRAWSGVLMVWVEGAIVFWAFAQFFGATSARALWRPLLGAVAFVLIKEALLWLYARAVIRIVLAQLA